LEETLLFPLNKNKVARGRRKKGTTEETFSTSRKRPFDRLGFRTEARTSGTTNENQVTPFKKAANNQKHHI
jgi:hypothetical protein